jgi:hypothetical protein
MSERRILMVNSILGGSDSSSGVKSFRCNLYHFSSIHSIQRAIAEWRGEREERERIGGQEERGRSGGQERALGGV